MAAGINPFTSRVTKTVTLPGVDVPIVIRKLNPKQLQQAAQAQQLAALEQAKVVASSLEGFQQLERLLKPEPKPELKSDAAAPAASAPGAAASAGAEGAESGVAAAATADPLMLFDRVTLMVKGVISWDYDEPVGQAETFEDLDEPSQVFLATEILKLAKPELFETPAQVEAAQKNA